MIHSILAGFMIVVLTICLVSLFAWAISAFKLQMEWVTVGTFGTAGALVVAVLVTAARLGPSTP